MRFRGEALLRLARRTGPLADKRWAPHGLFVLALGVWWLQALVIPLTAGRDMGTYLGAYVQLLHSHPIDLGFVLGRTPIAAFVVGGLLDVAGGAFAEPVISLLYAGSIVAWFLVARTFGRGPAILTAVVLLLYPAYGILFHELSSDAVFAAAFAAWSLVVVRVLRSPSTRGFVFVGVGVGILALVRPGNQVLLLFAALPLVLAPVWRLRLTWAVAFVVPALVLIGGWVVHNGLRYDNYTLARGGNATVPFFRTFVTDKIVEPSNGPASRELAAAVQRDLLPKEPYRSYGITLDDFFRDASPRMQVDLLALSDRLKGWHSNYRWLRDVGVEAARAHPATYARGVAGSVWGMLRQGLYRDPSSSGGSSAGGGGGAPATIVVDGRRLPQPTEGEPIPAAHEGGVTTPDFSIYTVWTSPSEHHLVFVHPGDKQRYDTLHRRMADLTANLPGRSGNATLAHRFNQSSRWFPPPIVWLVVALAALAVRRLRGSIALWVPTLAGLAVILLTALGLPADSHYSIPVAPAFVLLGSAALLASRRELAPVSAWRSALRGAAPQARWWGGVAVAAIAAAWALQTYVTKISDAFGAQAPHDLRVFLRAAGDMLHGMSPYVFRGDETYAYPPLLGLLTTPLHPLGAGAATLVWIVLSLAAVAVSLWLLGVRDWRCYAVASAYPITRSAVGLGTVGPFLLLGVAVAWRYRDRVVPVALAVGAAAAAKVFLWPLPLWLAITRRFRAAVAAALAAIALIVVPWAIIGFDGIGSYAHLLRRLEGDEATSSYSVVALAVRAHLPHVVGTIVALLTAALLLGGAAWSARRAQPAPRDRDVVTLTLVLAAALAASPIVWMHYFLLLVVPLALAYPRLSWLWFVPFAYAPLGQTAWPAGDARKLGLALVVTLVLLAPAAVTGLGGMATRPRLKLRGGEVSRPAPAPPEMSR